MGLQTECSAAEIVRASKSSFAFAFVFLDLGKRRAFEALYAFCRVVDDVVDDAEDPAEARQHLNLLKALIETGTLAGEPPLGWAKDLVESRQTYGILAKDLLWIISGVSQDLDHRGYTTLTELEAYCDGVASAVGLCMMPILGVNRDEAYAYAVASGRALQLTNILRDVHVDLDLGRVYLPFEFHRLNRDEFRSTWPGLSVEERQAMLTPLVDRILQHHADADLCLTALDRNKLMVPELLRKKYRVLFEKLMHQRAWGLKEVPKLNFLDKAKLLPGICRHMAPRFDR